MKMAGPSSENKEDVSKKHEKEKQEKIGPTGSLKTVFKDADGTDMLLMVMGTIGSIGDGSALALIMLCLSRLMNGYGSSALTIHDINKVGYKRTIYFQLNAEIRHTQKQF